MTYYAVRVGRQVGIYQSWDECNAQVQGFSGGQYAKFQTIEQAQKFLSSKLSKTDIVGVNGKIPSLERKNLKVPILPSLPPSDPQTPPPLTRKRQRKSIKAPTIISQYKNLYHISKHEKISDNLVIYTDGACCKNGRRGARAGFGVHFPSHPDLDTFGPLPSQDRQTNQRAELTAIKKALEICKIFTGNLEIRTDSMYSINCLTLWSQIWEGQGWKVDKLNLDLIRSIISIAGERVGIVYLKHVKGHSGEVGNEAADRLAVKGSESLINFDQQVNNS